MTTVVIVVVMAAVVMLLFVVTIARVGLVVGRRIDCGARSGTNAGT
jgi:hypothetical protein